MSVPSELTRWAYTDPPRAIYELYQLIIGGGGGGSFLPLAGGTMTGPLILAGDPIASLEAATKEYVDTKLTDAPSSGFSYGRVNGTWGIVLPLSGGTLVGPLVLNADPSAALGAATKQYVDNGLTLKAPIASPAFTGAPTSPTPATSDNSTAISTTAYVQAQGYATTAALGNYLPLTGGTLTGDLNINEAQANLKIKSTSTWAAIQMTPGAGNDCEIDAYNSAGVSRWTMLLNDGSAETGSNAGSNFRLYAYNDAGAGITPLALQITRATSLASFGGSINIPTGSFYQYNSKNLAYIVPNASGDNIFLGEAGNTTLTGSFNIGNGPSALSALTSGIDNIALGGNSLKSQTTGSNNTGIGFNSLQTEASGGSNTAVGVNALNTQNGASNNVGIGYLAGNDLTTGGSNTFVGYNTGRGITTGSGNTVVGYGLTGLPAALAGTLVLGASATKMSLVFGSNVFHGGSAGNLTLTGTANACMGWLSGAALTTGSNNCALGSSSLGAETTGGNNVALGKSALATQNGAGGNIAIGGNAGNTLTTGGSNIFIGTNAGNTITTGTGNVMINYSAGLLAAGTTNCFGWGLGGNIRYDYGLTTASTHTFTGGTVATNATPTAGASPVFVTDGGLTATTATSVTPALPASRVNGNLLIAFGRVAGSTGTTITCSTSGWTQILNNTGGGRAFCAYYAYVTGSEVAPVFTLGTSDTCEAWVVQYSGTAASNPIGASAPSSGGAVSSLPLTGISTTRYNSAIVTAILAGGLTGTFTPPASQTSRASNSGNGGWFDGTATTAGTATGTLTFTCSGVTNWGGFVIELLIPPMTPTAVRHNGNVLGTTRWSVELTDGTQESGSNAGSNFAIQRFSDAGVAIDTPISVNRATGQTTVTNLNPATLLRSYLAGLALSTAGASATFTVAAGIAVDSTNANMMSRTASLSKNTGAWAVGSSGSLDTGTIAASTWYHVYLIMRADTGVVDVLTSLSATAPTLPANYTLFRRIGSMLTNASSQWTKFLQTGDTFEWDVGVQEINGGSLASGSAVTVTLAGAPTGVKVVANLSGYATSTTAATTIAAWDADITGSATNNFLFIIPSANGEGSFAHGVMVNTSAQFKWQTANNLTSVNLFTTGWMDRRGRDA